MAAEVCYLLLYKSTTFKMLFDPRMLSLIFHNDPELQQFGAIVSAKSTLIDDANQKTGDGDGCVVSGNRYRILRYCADSHIQLQICTHWS